MRPAGEPKTQPKKTVVSIIQTLLVTVDAYILPRSSRWLPPLFCAPDVAPVWPGVQSSVIVFFPDHPTNEKAH